MEREEEARSEARAAALRAKEASGAVGRSTRVARDRALAAMARALREGAADALEANAADVSAARASGVSESLIDRLLLTPARIEDMAAALEGLADLPDPLGRALEQRTLPNGLELSRVSVPLGVVAVVYEARPNVTADAAGICLKSGNACVLRGGSMAARSNRTIACMLHDAAAASGMPRGCIESVAATDRAATEELMGLRGVVDVLVPRGGKGLIEHCVRASQVPVIETGTGNCHVYVHESADLERARAIVVNAKCRRFGVCNAAETLLVDEAVCERFLPGALAALAGRGILVHADERTLPFARAAGCTALPATEDDWEREYLAPELAVRVVAGLDEAVRHIERFGTRHSEAIVAEDASAADAFVARIDAAAVYVNASTAFTDGGQFGLGAEIGISTQKLHVRGPFALDGLTSYKYVVRGSGQVRS